MRNSLKNARKMGSIKDIRYLNMVRLTAQETAARIEAATPLQEASSGSEPGFSERDTSRMEAIIAIQPTTILGVSFSPEE